MRKTIILMALSLVAFQAMGQTKKKNKKPVEKVEIREIKVGEDMGEPNAIDPGIVEAPPQPVEAPPVAPEDMVFTSVEQMPEFPGGQQAMMKYIAAQIKYPDAAKESGIEGRVVIRFVVDRTGVIKDPVVMRGVGGGCSEEALRVIKGMPKWKPGKQNGKAVNVYYTLPVAFKLQGEPEPAPKQ